MEHYSLWNNIDVNNPDSSFLILVIPRCFHPRYQRTIFISLNLTALN